MYNIVYFSLLVLSVYKLSLVFSPCPILSGCLSFYFRATSFVRDRRTPICAGHMAGVKRRICKRSKPEQNKNGGCLYHSINSSRKEFNIRI